MASVHPEARRKKWLKKLGFLVVCILINLLLAQIPLRWHLPLYLDSVGTILASVLGGYVPGILVGYLTNLINGIQDVSNIYYGVLNVLIAVCAAFFAKRGWLKKLPMILLSILALSLIGGGLGSLLSWLMYGFDFGTGVTAPLAHLIYDTGLFSPYAAQLIADLLADIADKAISVGLVLLLLRLIPKKMQHQFRFRAWRQNPLHGEARQSVKRCATRAMSLRAKIMITASVAMMLIALATTGISFIMFRQSMVDAQINMAYGVSNVVISAFNPDRVEDYLTKGDQAEGYAAAEQKMIDVRDSSPDIEYVYVYQILEDGCHVVFDPDAGETPGSDPGTVIPFDQAFLKYVPDLLQGKAIEPVISDETYGWLLSIYHPVTDSSGKCVCYAGVDISMNQLRMTEYSFLAKAVSLFMSFFIVILGIILWLAQYSIVLPVNSMAVASGSFAYDSESLREESVEHLKRLGIRTGDEIENLYQSLTKMSEDTVQYIADVQQKNATISRMQDSLIAVLADMVESRDQYTGNHIRNTAAYAGIIMRQLLKENLYTDVLTEDYISDVLHSAPLHDVGKIHVSDTLLNKPGKLTDEEFAKMKEHTLAGRDIIAQAREAASDSSYLKEAQNLATYHHERWDGKGYPYGLAGEEIPLSARIMAVADVFDALVSKRSYKEDFSVEKSLEIIRDGIGSHFDPRIANAFLHAEKEVRAVVEANKQGEKSN